MPFESVAVLGLGLMGRGIAQVIARGWQDKLGVVVTLGLDHAVERDMFHDPDFSHFTSPLS